MALFPLNMIVEIQINGTWRDITNFVYQRDGITIQGGRSSESDGFNPATATMTLNNRDGRFSPNYASGQYYPYLQRNVQLRVSVNDTSSSGNVYNGFRFWGEVAEWPPVSDISGKDIYVSITASGPLRRQRQGGGSGSALARYYQTLTGSFAPVAYWPCEEDPNTGLIGSGVQGGANMTVVSGNPKFKAVSNFNGSAPIGVINKSTWTGVTSAFGTSGDDLFIAAGTYQWIASTATVNVKAVGGGGGGTKGQSGTASGGPAGGGGEWAGDTAVVVTPGQAYTVTVGAGGAAGSFTNGASDGTDSIFPGDAVTVTANGGSGAGPGSPGNGGAGGTGSANAIHHPGGAGANHTGASNAGAGGGGSGGSAATGNSGTTASGATPGSGGAAVTGGGKGGDGGQFNKIDGKDGGSPGGGGGGGWANATDVSQGGQGAPGSVELIYTSSGGGTQPNNNVLRFIMWVPKWGGNNSKVIIRALTSGTINKLDVQYRTGGNIRLFGFNSGGTQLFDSGNLAVGADNTTLMVSVELAKSGTAVAWAFSAIKPGDKGVVAKTNGSVASSSMGSVSQVIVSPNADVTKTALGHISIQYALIPLWKVSQALNGNAVETGVQRFIRLATEQALGNLVEYSEGHDHWGFEAGTQSWVATNGAVTQSSISSSANGWPTQGTKSLLLTANGAGSPSASGPTGTSGEPIQPGDVASMSIDLYSPSVTIGNAYAGIKYYTSGGTLISESDTADFSLPAGEVHTFSLAGAAAQAPATSAFFAVTFGNHGTLANGTQLLADHATVHPHMGPQTRAQYKQLLDDIEKLDQGIMKEARELWGVKYRTRIRMLNQSAAVTLDYAQHMISPPFAPEVDDQKLKNDITVKRKKGSKVQVTLNNGQMSIQEPPSGSGRYKKVLQVVANADEQLAALAAHLLTLGTVSDERYPTITVNLARAGITGNPLAPLMSAVAGVEIGDMVQINNLPFWYPSTTVKQLVIGYSETINAYDWTITWNCQPYTPYIQVTSNIRRW